MQNTKICLRCRCENQISAIRCSSCGCTFFENFPTGEFRDLLLAKTRKRIIACWIGAAAIMGLLFWNIDPNARWYARLFLVLCPEAMIFGWFGLMLYVQVKAAAQTPEGGAFRGPMPVWRAVFWTCVAAVGVFCCIYGSEAPHSWLKALLGALFCSSFIGAFSFILNWLRGAGGKAWAHKYAHQLLVAYTFILSASALLKMWEILSRK